MLRGDRWLWHQPGGTTCCGGLRTPPAVAASWPWRFARRAGAASPRRWCGRCNSLRCQGFASPGAAYQDRDVLGPAVLVQRWRRRRVGPALQDGAFQGCIRWSAAVIASKSVAGQPDPRRCPDRSQWPAALFVLLLLLANGLFFAWSRPAASTVLHSPVPGRAAAPGAADPRR